VILAAERGTGWRTVLRQGNIQVRRSPAGWNEDTGIAGRIILTWIFRKLDLDKALIGSSWLRIGTGGGYCKCGNEPSGSINFFTSSKIIISPRRTPLH